jgi:hypothetical protein
VTLDAASLGRSVSDAAAWAGDLRLQYVNVKVNANGAVPRGKTGRRR